MSHLNNVGMRHNKTIQSIMLNAHLHTLPNYMLLEMSSIWNLGSRAAGNIAVNREKLHKWIFSNMISKHRNFSWYNYYSKSRFFAWPHFISFG